MRFDHMIRSLISSAIALLMMLGAASLFAENENYGTAVPANPDLSIDEMFENISPKNIPGNVIKIIGDDWMLIGAKTQAKFNSMTALLSANAVYIAS